MNIGRINREERNQRIQRVQRIQKIENLKPTRYYDNRGLTKEDQTGEIGANLRAGTVGAKELFDRARAESANSKIYNKLKESEKDKVRKFKQSYIPVKSDIKEPIQENTKEVESQEIEESEPEI